MADSYLLTVEKALVAHLEATITPGSGSPYDLTGAVFRGRIRYGRQDPLPMISLLQSPDIEVDTSSSGAEVLRKGSKLYLLQGWAEDDPHNPTDPAHQLLAEAKRAIAPLMGDPDDPAFALKQYHPEGRDLVEGFDVGVGLVRPPDETISPNAYFWLPVRIGLVESLEDPYALP